ncbi:15936_t:CDS:2 [Funneliformis mosseae]|uniref:15936_t:CDS:1 n=1 Tax=Funneliformis mosseae TaxID=27381 RepID=A0A9N8W6P3_FUNMO|nr:15936_t:CDS:2 [Funneliformis mosseae]
MNLQMIIINKIYQHKDTEASAPKITAKYNQKKSQELAVAAANETDKFPAIMYGLRDNETQFLQLAAHFI